MLTIRQGTWSGEVRAIFIVNEAVVYWDRCQINEVIDEALSRYVNQYEQPHGMIQPIPTRKA